MEQAGTRVKSLPKSQNLFYSSLKTRTCLPFNPFFKGVLKRISIADSRLLNNYFMCCKSALNTFSTLGY